MLTRSFLCVTKLLVKNQIQRCFGYLSATNHRSIFIVANVVTRKPDVSFLSGHVVDRIDCSVDHMRRNCGGNGGTRPRNVETAGAKVSLRPRNNLPSLSAGS